MKRTLPSKSDFLDYFKHQEMNPKAIELFRQHYLAPGRAATAGELANAVGYKTFSAVNSVYGNLAKRIVTYWEDKHYWKEDELLQSLIVNGVIWKESTEIDPWLSIFMTNFVHEGKWVFYMSDELAMAIEEMNWVKKKDRSKIKMDQQDPDDPASYEEGGVKLRSVRQYERSIEARRKCIATNGDSCATCGISFGKTFGNDFEGLIVVHHLHPMAVGKSRKTDAENDLKPLCPNCHAMAHFGRPGQDPRTVEELKKVISQQKPHGK